MIFFLIKELLKCISFFFYSFFLFLKKKKALKNLIINRQIYWLEIGGTIPTEFGTLTNLQEL